MRFMRIYAHIFPLREISAHPIAASDFVPRFERQLLRDQNLSRHAARRHNCLAGLEKRHKSEARGCVAPLKFMRICAYFFRRDAAVSRAVLSLVQSRQAAVGTIKGVRNE